MLERVSPPLRLMKILSARAGVKLKSLLCRGARQLFIYFKKLDRLQLVAF